MGYLESLGFLSDAWINEVARQYADDFDGPFKDRTCLLPLGHLGSHEFVRDDEIQVRFI
jgi:hypothetical protein